MSENWEFLEIFRNLRIENSEQFSVFIVSGPVFKPISSECPQNPYSKFSGVNVFSLSFSIVNPTNSSVLKVSSFWSLQSVKSNNPKSTQQFLKFSMASVASQELQSTHHSVPTNRGDKGWYNETNRGTNRYKCGTNDWDHESKSFIFLSVEKFSGGRMSLAPNG